MTNTNNTAKTAAVIKAVQQQQQQAAPKKEFAQVAVQEFEVTEIQTAQRLYTSDKAFIVATMYQAGVLRAIGSKFRRNAVQTLQETSNARINALTAAVQLLESGAVEEAGETGIYLIFAPGVLVDAINNNSFRNWINTGAFKNGSKVSDLEMSLWARFIGAYSAVLHRVEFRNISTAAVQAEENGKRRAATIEEVRGAKLPTYRKNNHIMQERAWEIVQDSVGLSAPKHEEEVEVTEEE